MWEFRTYRTFENFWWPLHLIGLLIVIPYALENISTVHFLFPSTFTESGNWTETVGKESNLSK